MPLQNDLQELTKLNPISFERFAQLIDPAWIEQAQLSTGTVSIRRRRLPAERIVWLVVGLALFKSEPIWLIVQQLGLALGEAKVPAPVPQSRLGNGSERHRWSHCLSNWPKHGAVLSSRLRLAFWGCVALR